MPRPKSSRKIVSPPLMKGFKPFGIPRRELDTIVLTIDEYEAIRLLDYEGLTQEQAAEKMKYTPHKPRAVSAMRGVNLVSFIGPGVSAL